MPAQFTATPEEREIVNNILDRAMPLLYPKGERERLDVEMDLVATHSNGCPLDLQRLLDARDFDLAHDIYGIALHLDRSTGKLKDHFLPRCARRDPLLCEQNTPDIGRQVLQVFCDDPQSSVHTPLASTFEHGQWWIQCECGAAWSVNDATPGTFCFEQVSHGDEEFIHDGEEIDEPDTEEEGEE